MLFQLRVFPCVCAERLLLRICVCFLEGFASFLTRFFRVIPIFQVEQVKKYQKERVYALSWKAGT